MEAILLIFGLFLAIVCIALAAKINSLERKFNEYTILMSKRFIELTRKKSEPEKRSELLDRISDKKHDIEAMEAYIDQEPTEEDFREFIPVQKPPLESAPLEFTPPPALHPHPPVVKVPEPTPPSSPEPFATDPVEQVSLEQRIGTRWLLYAGVVAVLFAAAWFLKYAIETFNLGPRERTIAVVVGGLIALVAGEITRRRGYGIVAKGVTALGFALLYTAVFFASQVYGLIGIKTAFAFSVLITAATMVYAVGLDEIIIEFLALVGGYLTAVIGISDKNASIGDTQLFGYILILGIGAMACACYRKWRYVNVLSFIGTFGLFTLWFNYTYGSVVNISDLMPLKFQKGMSVAITWLTVFFLVYLILPVLYELIKKTAAKITDVWLLLINSIVTFFFLWTMLYLDHKMALGCCSLGLCLIYFAMLAVARIRCPEDKNFHAVLLAVAILFLTMAIPLFFRANVLSVAWAAEAVVLGFISLRYKNALMRIGSFISMTLCFINLLYNLPMHGRAFDLILNPDFVTWILVAITVYVHHILYRLDSASSEDNSSGIAQGLFIVFTVILAIASSFEWCEHCKYNLDTFNTGVVFKGELLIASVIMLLFLIRPLCPDGAICRNTFILPVLLAAFCCAVVLASLHKNEFTFLFNRDFFIVLAFIVSVGISHNVFRQSAREQSVTVNNMDSQKSQWLYILMGLTGFFLLAVEWYFHCDINLASVGEIFYRGLAVIFAVTILFFITRPLCPEGLVCKAVGIITAAAGSFLVTAMFFRFYDGGFTIFFNKGFMATLLFIGAVAGAGALLNRNISRKEDEDNNEVYPVVFGLLALGVLWIVLTEQIYIYYYWRNQVETLANWKNLAQMYISVMWAFFGAALMIAGFWQKIKLLRYIALALFGLLLAKVFIIDTSKIPPVYRVGAFMATGLTLVGVSYLYQFLKKKGFFDTMLNRDISTEAVDE